VLFAPRDQIIQEEVLVEEAERRMIVHQVDIQQGAKEIIRDGYSRPPARSSHAESRFNNPCSVKRYMVLSFSARSRSVLYHSIGRRVVRLQICIAQQKSRVHLRVQVRILRLQQMDWHVRNEREGILRFLLGHQC